jgi:glucose-1-phosphate thymidylyltransferase
VKGIVLAGGTGSRLFPLTLATSKQLLPVYDKPLVYYPLATLMLAGIRDVLLISTPDDLPGFRRLLGDGSAFGLRLAYAAQPRPDGIAQAFLLGEGWIAGEPCALVLGDNIIHGPRLPERLTAAARRCAKGEATIFTYRTERPERYGVAEFDADGRVRAIEEKPKRPKSDWAVIGLYFYDGRAAELARRLAPSARGELEITDLNLLYAGAGALRAEQLGRDFTWMDAGTPESLLEATVFVQALQEREDVFLGCPEEIAFRRGYIAREQLRARGLAQANTGYGRRLLRLADEAATVAGAAPGG